MVILKDPTAVDSPFAFDKRKAEETVIYVALKAPIPDRFHICKIIYFADKYHLQHYGRFIFGDRYIAMKNGPVPSGAYDVIKAADETLPQKLATNDFDVIALRDPDLSLFSESDLEALDTAIAEYGKMSFNRLSLLSHDEAWKATTQDGELVRLGGRIPIEFIKITGMMPNPDALLDYIKEYY
jgi:uncharacterized phage-associated protein